ncbi:alkaline-shock protein [Philodulcilactobacillus myokoensis]|uniref:Alkaline-shock protein n=1 Tax=Philodulcilactobacillus myokoensis TaxID=2929573 RepID=A0A9W6B1Q4_9LACO|nr:Asp23/Gls24 family envelope stress response protein [Philodulcilactobacillus myokoensis]GLB46798.1 alkaline-shock protein [Philodulcilactobacillus myokoensis]
MAEESNIVIKAKHPDLGKIEIAPQVLEIIASIAAVQVKGVKRMRGSFANGVNELFGRKEFGKGIKLSFNQNKLSADIYVFLNYGVSVPKVALEIQDQVKQQLLFMTELDVGEINVHVEGVIPKKDSTSKFNSNNLFNNDVNDKGEHK